MVAAAVQLGLGQDNSLSMPSRLCLGAPSEYSDQVVLQPCKLHDCQRPSQPGAFCRANRSSILIQRLSWSSRLRNGINR